MGTDLDIPSTVDSIEDLRSKIAEHFKPTECEVRTRNGDVVVELDYKGFKDYATAAEHAADHALRLERLGGCDDVNFSASNHGGYDPEEEERDPRPSGHINATFTPSPSAEEGNSVNGSVQPNYGDRVTYFDNGKPVNAIVVDPARDEEFITVVTGAKEEFGEGYNHDVESHSSVRPHADLGEEYMAEDYAFKPGWNAEESD